MWKHYSDSGNPFDLDYFAYFNSNYVNFVFKDIITSEKNIKKLVKFDNNNKNKYIPQWDLNPGPLAWQKYTLIYCW